MKAVILAAGYATRLYPLTENTPKCLLTVGGRTILDSLCDQLEKIVVIDEIVIVTNTKFYEQLSRWQQKRRQRAAIRVLNDGTSSNETRLGAVGDLDLTIREAGIQTDVLMMASDNLFDQNLEDFVSFARSRAGSVSIAIYDLGDPRLASKKFGVIEVDKDKRVTGMEEKPEHPKSSLIGMGVYYFPQSSLVRVGEYLQQKNAQDAPGYYIRWLHEHGAEIFSFLFSGMWYDIGDLKALEEANAVFNKKI